MITAMGLALGIDYSLFVVSRYREQRATARTSSTAICRPEAPPARRSCSAEARSWSRSRSAAGTRHHPAQPGVGAIIVGLITMAAALTLLPAFLSMFGDRVNALRLPFFGREHSAESPFWSRAVGAVVRRPGAALAVGVLVLLALAFPVLDLRTGTAGVSTLPDGTYSKAGFLAVERSFPRNASSDPAQIVVSGDTGSPPVSAAMDRLEASIAADPEFGPPTRQIAPTGQVALISVPLLGDPGNDQARQAVQQLRSDLVPAAFDGTDAEVFVGGTTAENIDYSDLINRWLPIVLTFVLGLSFILLTVVFRSVVISATAVVLNLLSVGGGVRTPGARVPEGSRRRPAGIPAGGEGRGMGADLPVLGAVRTLDGLPRVPAHAHPGAVRPTGDTVDAVIHGIAATGRIITGAALIIVVVFAGFATGDLVMFQQMGFGVGVALLVDATLIRMVIVPAAMSILGRWNWYLPSWLNWLPEFHVEGDQPTGTVPEPQPASMR